MLVVQSEAFSAELEEAMDALERDCRKVLDAESYQTPEHVSVKEIPIWRRAAMRVDGFIMQAFRYLV